MTGLPSVVFEAIQENVPTSDANDAYRALIEATCGLDEFIACPQSSQMVGKTSYQVRMAD